MTDLEKFITYRDTTAAEFNAWNEKQPETRKIKNRLPFTLEYPTVKFLPLDKKDYIDKDGKSGVNKFHKMKAIDSQGSEVGYKVQLPSVIAPRGYALSKGDNGEIMSILIVFDLENPDHKLTCDNIDKMIVEPVCHEIMKAPGAFSMSSVPTIQTIDENIKTSDKYKMALMLIKGSISKIINLPKINKTTYDENSTLRTMFLNPLEWTNPEKPTDPPMQMLVSLKLYPGVPATPISPNDFAKLCEGKIYDAKGKVISQKRLGCECSPEVVFSKLNIGSKVSAKKMCTAVTVTRFQEAPKTDTQLDKQNYMDQHGVIDEFSSQFNLDEILASIRSAGSSDLTQTQTPTTLIPQGNTFNPMGIDSVKPENNGGSLLTSLSQTPQQIMTQQSLQQTTVTEVQPPPNPMIQQFGTNVQSQPQFPNQLQPQIQMSPFQQPQMQIPQFQVQNPSVPTLNMSLGINDRLSNFQPNMIPMSGHNGSI